MRRVVGGALGDVVGGLADAVNLPRNSDVVLADDVRHGVAGDVCCGLRELGRQSA